MRRSFTAALLCSLIFVRGAGAQPPQTGAAVIPAAATPNPAPTVPDSLVGDADFGKLLFNGARYRCSTCHAVTPGVISIGSNLSTVGAKFANARTLQNNMLLNRGQGWSPANDKSVVVDLTWKDGRKLSGYMTSVSDFKAIIRAEDGGSRVIPIVNGDPKVVIRDRMQAHLDMLPTYSDEDLHDLTAYLASLK